jgi:hypothetical protein
MKNKLLFTAAFIFILSSCTKIKDSTAVTAAPGESSSSADVAPVATDKSKLERIELHTEMIDGATHWAPQTITIKAGKEYMLVAKHDLPGGFDFHGLQLKEFGVSTQVNRGKEFTQVIDVPADKKGTYTIGCQFHPKHVAAKLIVE